MKIYTAEMALDSQLSYLINRDTGEIKKIQVDAAKKIVAPKGDKSNMPPTSVTASFPQSGDYKEELRELLSRERRIKKYVEDIFKFNKMIHK